MLKLDLTKRAIKELKYWQKSEPKTYKKILEIIEELRKQPFSGAGKPEPLRFKHSEKWSRRTTKEHRLVYEVLGDKVIIHQCKFYY